MHCGRVALSSTKVKYLVNNANLRWVQYGMKVLWSPSNPNPTTTVLPNEVKRMEDWPGILSVKNNVNTYFIGRYAPFVRSTGKIVNNTLTYAAEFWKGEIFPYKFDDMFQFLTCARRNRTL
jgi:hypothetical protein